MSRQATGLRAWLFQRISAVYLALFSLVLVWRLLVQPPADYGVWRAWVGTPWVSAGLFLFIVALLVHMWVGLRDVLIDYIHPLGLRLVLLTLFALGFLASGYWALQALILAHLGA